MAKSKSIKAITLKRPWSWAITHMDKRVENRTWKPPSGLEVGDRLAIHAGKGWDEEGYEFLLDMLDLREYPGITSIPDKKDCPEGIVAVCRYAGLMLPGTLAAPFDPWFCGPYGWVLDSPVALPNPIPCKGALGLWPLPKDLHGQVTGEIGKLVVSLLKDLG